VLQQLAPQYIATGKVRVIYRNFPLIGAESEEAAQAAECAGDQNKFWVYADYLFAHQEGENQGAFTKANLENFAARLGLNSEAFNACLDSGKYGGKVTQEQAEGVQRGVVATPTFFINGTRHEGLLSAQQLADLINAALAK
jgi:protein-disulfide isomerase